MPISYYIIIAVLVVAGSVLGALIGMAFFPHHKEPPDES